MGNCCGRGGGSSSTQTPTPNTSTGLTGTSATTSQTISSSRISSCSGQSGISTDDSFPNGKVLSTHNLRRFTFQELKTATKNFKLDNMLGEGGFGKVYRGTVVDDKVHNQQQLQQLQQQQSSSSSSSYSSSSYSKSSGGMVVAVKKLNSESLQGFKEWQAEIDFLGRLSHPNLVKLLGYCWEEEELLLIYEYMQRGSLENHLFGRGSAVKPLPWELRLKIAIGAARGFAFLHASDDRVIYRDIKAANILLDGVYNAKISDFGLAKLGPSASQSHVTTQVMGTYGYAAPEYMATGHLYIKSDVYSFGVVMTELLTGLRAQDPTRPSGRHTLTDWIKPYLSNKRRLKQMMDSRLQGRYPHKAAFQMAQLSLKCLAHEPKFRPSMKEVVETLEQIQDIGESRNNNKEPSRKTGNQATGNGGGGDGGLRDQRVSSVQQGRVR